MASLGVFDGYLPLEHDKFTSMTKIGGSAVFTFPDLMAPELQEDIKVRTTCKSCGVKMFLLAQAFAPLEGTHNRMIYVFGCNSDACALRPDSSFVSFAVQFDRLDTEAMECNDAEADDPVPVEATPRQLLPLFTLPPLAVDIVDEPEKEEIVPTDVEAEMIKAAEANGRSDVTDEDIAEMAHQLDLKDKPIDVYFDKFRKRLARCPLQLMRYHRGGLSLFMNPDKTIYLTVPPCDKCGKERALEMQLLPTLLYFCHAEKYVPEGKLQHDDGIDFATVTIYSCRDGCQRRSPGVVLEQLFAFVEPAPTLEEESHSCGGKLTLREYFAQPS